MAIGKFYLATCTMLSIGGGAGCSTFVDSVSLKMFIVAILCMDNGFGSLEKGNWF